MSCRHETEVAQAEQGVTMGFPKLQPTDVHLGSTGNVAGQALGRFLL